MSFRDSDWGIDWDCVFFTGILDNINTCMSRPSLKMTALSYSWVTIRDQYCGRKMHFEQKKLSNCQARGPTQGPTQSRLKTPKWDINYTLKFLFTTRTTTSTPSLNQCYRAECSVYIIMMDNKMIMNISERPEDDLLKTSILWSIIFSFYIFTPGNNVVVALDLLFGGDRGKHWHNYNTTPSIAVWLDVFLFHYLYIFHSL